MYAYLSSSMSKMENFGRGSLLRGKYMTFMSILVVIFKDKIKMRWCFIYNDRYSEATSTRTSNFAKKKKNCLKNNRTGNNNERKKEKIHINISIPIKLYGDEPISCIFHCQNEKKKRKVENWNHIKAMYSVKCLWYQGPLASLEGYYECWL